ncbi:hypothetical protein D3C87_1290640 [compost metagenome]
MPSSPLLPPASTRSSTVSESRSPLPPAPVTVTVTWMVVSRSTIGAFPVTEIVSAPSNDRPFASHAYSSGAGPVDSTADSEIGAPASTCKRPVILATTPPDGVSPGTTERKIALWSVCVPSFTVSLTQ